MLSQILQMDLMGRKRDGNVWKREGKGCKVLGMGKGKREWARGMGVDMGWRGGNGNG